jgi:tryptophanyl-tRNA synthetase
MARIVSGVRATGELHLGNYLGALRQWAKTKEDERFFFIADLHALTDVANSHDAKTFSRRRMATAAAFIAAGANSDSTTLFFQSDVSQHSELMWFLCCIARKGELERMTQWKDKSGNNQSSSSAALFTYPILMAADILLYDAEEVPVGDDQRQHVEIARDWAERFNYHFGQTFTIPRATIPQEGARIMDLQDPGKKMSKSSPSQSGTILIQDHPDTIRTKIRRATTDSENQVRYRNDKQGIKNLIEIHSATTGMAVAAIEKEFDEVGYGVFKDAVADAVIADLQPVAKRIHDLLDDKSELAAILDAGALQARDVADGVVRRVREAIGFDYLGGKYE